MTNDDASLAVERAVDAALGEVVRQAGAIGSQIMLEARGCGLDAGRFTIEHVDVFVWLVITHGHVIRGIWSSEEKARVHAGSFFAHPDIGPEIVRFRTDVKL